MRYAARLKPCQKASPMNHRRKLMIALGAAAVTAPLAAFAQAVNPPAGKTWRIGYLAQTERAFGTLFYNAFAQRLREIGYAEGSNLVIEARFAEGDVARLPGLAVELVQLKVDVIIAMSLRATSAAKAATAAIPIVMPATSDPVGFGLIQSLARPGGNITGFSDMSNELGPKRLEMLLAMMASPASGPVPARMRKASRVAVLGFAANPAGLSAVALLQEASLQLGVTIVPLYASTPEAIGPAFASMRQQKVDGLLLLPTPLFTQQSAQIAQLAMQQRLPVSAPYGVQAEAGCLMSYGVNLVDNMRRAATLADKIFKGAKPAELPVEQPVKFDLLINGKTAKTLGLKIPQALLILADRVIE